PRVVHGCGHRHLGGKVVDAVNSSSCLRKRVRIPHVTLDESEQSRSVAVCLEPLEVALGAPPRQVVEHRDLEARLQQVTHQVGADEPGSACDKDLHAHSSSAMTAGGGAAVSYRTAPLPT